MVRRLIEAVPAGQLDAAGALLLGEALYELGVFDEAERVLALGQELSSSENVALRLAVTRSKNANWGLCQPETALAINAAARAVVTARPLAEQLVADEAADAVTTAESGFAEHTALGDELAIAHPATHVINQVFALTEAGRLAEAGGLALRHRFGGPRRLALSGLALAHALLGEADAAAQALAERATVPAFGFLGPEQQLADAWTAVVSRRPREAAERLRAAAAQAASTGHRVTESWLLHDLMRISGEDTSARLRELAEECDSPLVAARARHAAAARARDAPGLAGAAGDFEALGSGP